MTALSPTPKQQFLDGNGIPLIGGKLYTYSAGTTTPLATFTDSTGTVANTNPVILDARGEAAVWLSDVAYKYVLKDENDVTIWTIDNVRNAASVTQYESIIIEVTEQATAVAAGTSLRSFRMPYAMTVQEVLASVATAQTSGNTLTIDINEGDTPTSILSTKLTVDNAEKTSSTAATAAVVSDTALAKHALVSVDVDQIGDGTAAGLIVYINGFRA